MNNVQIINKAAVAQTIFVEESAVGEEKLRARCIARFKSELSMSAPGASTYFQNCKKKAAGLKVPHYYKRRTPAQNRSEVREMEAVLLLTHQQAERWIAVQNNVEINFRTRGEAQKFAKDNGGEWKDRNKAA